MARVWQKLSAGDLPRPANHPHAFASYSWASFTCLELLSSRLPENGDGENFKLRGGSGANSTQAKIGSLPRETESTGSVTWISGFDFSVSSTRALPDQSERRAQMVCSRHRCFARSLGVTQRRNRPRGAQAPRKLTRRGARFAFVRLLITIENLTKNPVKGGTVWR